MLNKLTIKNIALIDRAELEFGKGLNVLSGETGSGKSVLLDSINFALGAKADKSMIRYGEAECSVSASFLLPENSPVFDELDEMGIDKEEELIIYRRFRTDGRGDIKINGSPVNVSMLKRITAHLVDVHGQSEHFFLLNESNQLKLIDRVAGEDVEKIKGEITGILSSLRYTDKRLAELGGDEKERGRKIDILKFQVNEIDEAALVDGEEEKLLAKKQVMNNLERIGRSLSEARELLGGEESAIDRFRSAYKNLSDLARFGNEYAALGERLENLCLEAEDIYETVSSAAEDLFYDENEAEIIEKRLDLLKSLKKKYGNSVSEIIEYQQKISDELNVLLHCDDEIEKLQAEKVRLHEKLYTQCCRLTKIRRTAAENFSAKVTEELRTLNIKNANFYAEFDEYGREDSVRATQNGLDSMRFMFSANKGEPMKPLSKVISGGEMSRLMLAIKTRMSDINDIDTYIFDEIDAGISGNTAKVVAEKFATISKQKQIIAVSHLAQISAMAEDNYVISKKETDGGKTLTCIEHLDEKGKIAELMRLLGGENQSGAANKLAMELIEVSKQFKS